MNGEVILFDVHNQQIEQMIEKPKEKTHLVEHDQNSVPVEKPVEQRPVLDELRKKVWKENSSEISLFGQKVPFIYPTIRDPRLVQIGILSTVNLMGQLFFHFRINPLQIFLVVATSIFLDVLLTYISKKIILFPASGFISGLSMAFLLQTTGGAISYFIYILAGILAIFSKQFITTRNRHIFNPSNFAVVYILLAFPHIVYITPDEWKASLFLILPIIAVGTRLIYKARVIPVTISFLLTETILFLPTFFIQSGNMLAALNHLRILLFSPSILIFTLYMITDPRTAPAQKIGKIVYGTATALLHFVFYLFGLGTLGMFLSLFFVCMGIPFLNMVDFEKFEVLNQGAFGKRFSFSQMSRSS